MSEENLTKEHVDIISRQRVYQGFFAIDRITLRHRLFNGGQSQTLTRELFIRGKAVAAVLYDPRHRLIGLVEQFRIGLIDHPGSPWCCEVVAGMAEAGESAQEVILREIEEEAGVKATQLHKICEYFSSPGGSSEKLSVYCAIADLKEAGGIYGLPAEGEDIKMQVYPETQVLDNLYSGCYANATTLIALQWLAAHKQLLQV